MKIRSYNDIKISEYKKLNTLTSKIYRRTYVNPFGNINIMCHM